MTRESSITVYYECEANGLLSACRLEALRVITFFGPCTIAEAGLHTKLRDKTFTPRFAELRNRGSIAEMPEKVVCSATGNMAIQWYATGKYPKEPPKMNAIERVDRKIMYHERKAEEARRQRRKMLTMPFIKDTPLFKDIT